MLRRLFGRPRNRALPELTSAEAYAAWARTYPAEAHNALMRIEQAAMLELLPSVAGQAVLDLACGTGRYLHILAERHVDFAIGIDNSLAMLRQAQFEHLIQADARALPLRRAHFDGVICGLALGHLADLTKPLSVISHVLKPNGWLLLSDFHPFQALNGAQRTFQSSDGKWHAVEHYAHLYADYQQAGQAVGLAIGAVAEPLWQGKPVVLVLRCRKLP